MQKAIVLSVLLLLPLTLIFAAAGDEDGFVGPNRLRTSPSVSKYLETDDGVPRYVTGRFATKVARGTEVAAAYGFFNEHKGAYRMADPEEELSLERIDVDDIGMRHVRFKQEYNGLPVIGRELIVHFGSDDILKTVNGSYEPYIDIETTPAIDKEEATRLAEADLRSFFGKGEPRDQELVVFPWEDTNYLAWRLFIYSDTPMGRWEYFIDARTGEVIYKANRIMDVDAVGTGINVLGDPRDHIDVDYTGTTYQMRDYTRQAGNNPHGHDGQMPAGNYIQTNVAGYSLPGSIATDADNYWDDPTSQSPAVDGHVYTGLMYDYLLHHFGRNGYDDNGHGMLTIVNYSGDGDNNAYWDGSRIVVWSWSTGWRSLATCPDVIAHEWGHAVTEYTSGLVYEKEPGALNESFSDMIGAAFEFYHDTLDSPDWLMGENGRTTGAGFRDMENPHNNGDPDTYGTSDPYWIDVVGCSPSYYNDYCGVHTNSGVGNKWFYLYSDGGTHNGQSVVGVGVQNAIKVAYRANAFYWTASTDYHEAALATLDAADDLDPSGAWATRASQAWNAVNVSTPLPTLRFSFPDGPAETVSPNSVTTFPIVIRGVYGAELQSGSQRLHYTFDNIIWQHIQMPVISADTFLVELPTVACDNTVEYYFSGRQVDGGSIDYPDPSNPLTAFAVTQSILALEDNFETDQGWTVSGDATDGQWERGVPVDFNRGDPPSDYDGSGQCYLTDNDPSDSNSDVDGGTTILTSPALDLSGGGAVISYARWFDNTAGSAPNEDVFYVFLSNDNGNSWMKIDSAGPVEDASGGWVEKTIWVNDYMPSTAQVRVKYEASDLGSGSVVEAGVDKFSAVVYSCSTGEAPIITTTDLPEWTIGVPYSEQLNATGGNGTLDWSDKFDDLVGTGLQLDAGGAITGTPTVAGSISFTAVVTDDSSATDERSFSITVNQAVTVDAATLPDWTVNTFFSQQLSGSGGTGTLSWSDKNGDLAGTGLTLSSAGMLSGLPATAGPISFTALLTDEVSATGELAMQMTVNGAIVVDDVSLPEWTAGVAYSQQLTSQGGTGAHSFADKNGDLSGTGLTLDSDGLISGVPAVTGTISFTAEVTDAIGANGERPFSFDVNSPVAIIETTCPDGTEDEPYNYQLTAAGGTGSLTWTDVNDDLSAIGLSLGEEGLISGTAIVDGDHTFTARAEDAVGSADQFEFSIHIETAFICGDINGDDAGPAVNDLTYLVDFLFRVGPPPPVSEAADVNASGDVNVTDLTALVDFLFRSGDDLVCP